MTIMNVEYFSRLLYIGKHHAGILQDLNERGFLVDITENLDDTQKYIQNCLFANFPLPGILLVDCGTKGMQQLQELVGAIRQDPHVGNLPIILLDHEGSSIQTSQVRRIKVDDYFSLPFSVEVLERRMKDLQLTHSTTRRLESVRPPVKPFRLPLWKRAFDILGASLIILMLSPLFLLTILLIRLESKGPIFYVSKRVGTGYKIFGFYKFRSMRVNADSMLDKLKKENNQYAQAAVEEKVKTPVAANMGIGGDEIFLVQDDEVLEEYSFLEQKKTEDENAFVKIENDPRITRVGKFIRNSSIDELPQLFNVLQGDMSLVGNRPLPLYEAEKLTNDDYSLRFMAPAGITGLWQVEERGSSDVSAENRKKWDIEYAQNFSLWMDLKILLKTIPAVVQKANV